MELLTNILIWLGILTAVIVVALAVHEFIWKPRQGENPAQAMSQQVRSGPVSRSPEPVEIEESETPDEETVEPGSGKSESEVVDVPAGEPDEERFKRLSRSQRLGLARLTVMDSSFDRVAGLAVAACKEEDFDAVVASGLLVLDEESGRYELTPGGRLLGGAHLTPEEANLVRQFHIEHFSRLVENIQASAVEDREAAVMGFELVQAEWAHLASVLEILSSGEDRELEFLEFAEAVNSTGIFQTRTDDGLRWYAIMAATARRLGDPEKELDAVTCLGAIEAQLGRHQDALVHYTRGAEICRELKDRHQEGSCLGNMGLALQNLGRIDEAADCFEEVLVIMRDEEDVMRQGFALASLGHVAEQKGDYAKAIELHEEHLKLNLENGDQRGEMMALSHLGEAYLASGQAPEAISRFERQLKLAGSNNDMPAEGNALGNLGRSYRAEGNPDKAAEYFGRQIEIAHLLKDTSVGMAAMSQLGQCHQDANRTWKAVECFDDQLKLARQVGDQLEEARSLRSAAKAVRSLGRLPDAITRMSAALAIFESLEAPETDEARADLERWKQMEG